MKVVVIGAGGVGGYFGGLLAKAGHDVTFIARGEHLEKLKEHGLIVKSVHGDFQVKVGAELTTTNIEKADLIIFAVKSYDTETATQMIKNIIDEKTIVLNLQNGVDNEEKMAKIIAKENIMPGLVYIESTISEPGVIEQKSVFRDIIFGEEDGSSSERANFLLEILQKSDIKATLTSNILVEKWKKFMFISTFSGITTLAQAPVGEVLKVPEIKEIILRMLKEVDAIAKKKGINLGEEIVNNTMEKILLIAPTTKSSMQRDLEKGKRLEIDSLSGAVVRIAKELNVDVPIHQTVAAFVKVLGK